MAADYRYSESKTSPLSPSLTPPNLAKTSSASSTSSAAAANMNSSEKEKATHIKFMQEALAMAEYALSHSETPVGCIFVHSPTSTIIGRGYNHTNQTFNGTRHAEFVAVNEILTSCIPPTSSTSEYVVDGRFTTEVFKECDLYVTVEPCIMCASFLRQLGIKRVFFGAGNEKFGGTGGVLNIQLQNGKLDSFPEQRLPAIAGGGRVEDERNGVKEEERQGWGRGDYEVSGGWLREEAIVMLRRFYVQENGRAPEDKRGKEGRVLRLDVEPLG